MVDFLLNCITVILALMVALVGLVGLAYIFAGIVGGLLFCFIILDENNWFLRPGKEKASVRRERKRQQQKLLANINARQEWVDSIVRRARSLPGGDGEVLHRGSSDGYIYLKVVDPGGCVTGYDVWRVQDGWRVYMFEDFKQFGVEADVDAYIEENRLWSQRAPWVVSLSGVFPHQVLMEVIDYATVYPEGF